jgi:hypothetical protein
VAVAVAAVALFFRLFHHTSRLLRLLLQLLLLLPPPVHVVLFMFPIDIAIVASSCLLLASLPVVVRRQRPVRLAGWLADWLCPAL